MRHTSLSRLTPPSQTSGHFSDSLFVRVLLFTGGATNTPAPFSPAKGCPLFLSPSLHAHACLDPNFLLMQARTSQSCHAGYFKAIVFCGTGLYATDDWRFDQNMLPLLLFSPLSPFPPKKKKRRNPAAAISISSLKSVISQKDRPRAAITISTPLRLCPHGSAFPLCMSAANRQPRLRCLPSTKGDAATLMNSTPCYPIYLPTNASHDTASQAPTFLPLL